MSVSWTEVSDTHPVSTGERLRCEFGDETDQAVELTATEAMEGNPVRHLFRGQAVRYYTVSARTPADDAGEVAALRAEVVKLRDRWQREIREASIARAEADRLRVTLDELLTEHEPVLGVFAGKAGILGCACLSARDYRAAGFRGGQDGYRKHLRAILAADPVSLADVREEVVEPVQCDARAPFTWSMCTSPSGHKGMHASASLFWFGRPHSEQVTDRG